MQHITYSEESQYPVGILIRESAMNKNEIHKHYVTPLMAQGVPQEAIIVFSLDYNEGGKAPVTLIRKYLESLAKPLDSLGTKLLYVADGSYFKPMAKVKKVAPYYGYCLPCHIEGFEDVNLVVGASYKGLFHNPDSQKVINTSLAALANKYKGTYSDPGQGIIHHAEYPETFEDIEAFLNRLHQHDTIVCDIETFDLKPELAGLGTIGFSWSEHSGGAFCVEYKAVTETEDKEYHPATDGYTYGWRFHDRGIVALIKKFFETYKGTVIYHGITFDAKILTRMLFMNNAEDYAGQLEGIDVMTRGALCTKTIAYLATNNCVRNTLSLKDLAQEFAGNWAQDEIENICLIPKDKLLQYNLVDCLCTYWVFKKYYPIMVEDDQQDIHDNFYVHNYPVIIDTELNGMPMNNEEIQRNDQKLNQIIKDCEDVIKENPLIKEFIRVRQNEAWIETNLLLKTKQHPIEYFSDPDSTHYVGFNPGSSKQLATLLFDQWGFTPTAFTKTKAPATGADVLQGILNGLVREHKLDPENDYAYPTSITGEADCDLDKDHRARALHSIIDLSKAAKISNTFFKAFKAGHLRADLRRYLQGNFNLTGTKSGRLSSSKPNLQNLPSSGTIYAKMVKRCFQAADGWLMLGADFDSLEDRISALTTKDPNKLKVYTDGYDGHCLRAYAYFGKDMPDIVKAEKDEKCFKVKIGSCTHWVKEGTLVKCPNLGEIRIEEFYENMEDTS